MNRMWLIAAIVMFAVFATADSRPRKPKRIAQGDWGGQHISVSVSESTATVEFDCANGRIEGPLTIDLRGRFNLKGTFSKEHGGPVRIDEKPGGQPARYTGWTDGRKMTLTVTVEGSKEALETFNLSHGSPGRLFKCR
jgi:hypothetical protein